MAFSLVCNAFYIVASIAITSCAIVTVSKDEHANRTKEKNGELQHCLMDTQAALEVLPGLGWDNLQNLQMGQVLDTEYYRCKITPDRKFLIPDEVLTIPIKKSNVQLTSKIMTHFSNYTSTTAFSINAKAKVPIPGLWAFAVSGSFDTDFMHSKMNMLSEKTVVSRTELRYVLYTIRSQPDHKLNPVFKNRLLDIASFIQSNEKPVARYLTGLLIRDFGTHCITSVDAGGVLVKEDHLDYSETESKEETKVDVKIKASLSFLSILNIASIGLSFKYDQTKVDDYMSKCRDTRVITHGGPIYRANFSLDRWVDDLENNLVAVDMSGIPLYYLITTGSLPELPIQTVNKLASFIESEVRAFYRHNMYPGCTNPDDENYSYIANVDDGSCKAQPNNYTFGGVYQTCSGDYCTDQIKTNPLTGGYSCPPNYKAYLLQRVTVTRYHHDCHKILWWCHYHDWTSTDYDIEIYWCAASGEVGPNTGFLFGGVYTSETPNLFTGTNSCPDAFVSVSLGHDGQLTVCMSHDYQLGSRLAVAFAGFFSCKSGNPLASQKMQCPKGYSQHLWAIYNGCEIDYCVQTKAFEEKDLPKIKLPPYTKKPDILYNSTRLLITSMDRIMMKRPNAGKWELTKLSPNAKMADVEELINASFIMPSHPVDDDKPMSDLPGASSSSSSNSVGMTVALSIVSTALVGVIILFIIVVFFRNRKTGVPYQMVRSLRVNEVSDYGALEGSNLPHGGMPASSSV